MSERLNDYSFITSFHFSNYLVQLPICCWAVDWMLDWSVDWFANSQRLSDQSVEMSCFGSQRQWRSITRQFTMSIFVDLTILGLTSYEPSGSQVRRGDRRQLGTCRSMQPATGGLRSGWRLVAKEAVRYKLIVCLVELYPRVVPLVLPCLSKVSMSRCSHSLYLHLS